MKTIVFFTLNFWVGSLLFLITSTMRGQSNTPIHIESTSSSGKVLFEQNCSKCHGIDGTKGLFGAKNLQKSILSDELYYRIISKGKGIMPAWEKKLTTEQIGDILSYIKTLKK